MGFKCKVIASFVILLIFSFAIVTNTLSPEEKNYEKELISFFLNSDRVAVSDIFSFKFSRGYIIDDYYISGEGLVKRYDLDISISQVQNGISENIQRIVFVDADGLFVYEFKCDRSKLILKDEGLVIYPETVIEKVSSGENRPLTLYFNSLEYYN